MHELAIRSIEASGYWGIFLLMVLENIVPPIPSELILGIGGIALARGTFDLQPLLAAATTGSVLGNYAWYALGDTLGYERLRGFVDRHGRWLTVDWDDVERASDFFRRHGQWMVFFLRFFPFMRTLISLPAGLSHMSAWKFLLFTAAGALLWNTLLLKGAEWLGSRFAQAEVWAGWAAIASVVVFLAWYVWRLVTWRPKA
jgi:membrane protein DedA with SNARE-associated domain